MYNICYLCLMFLIYSVIGYLIEVVTCSMHAKRLVLNRGFLIGPCLPIYGSSVVLMYVFLNKYQDDIITLFVMCCFVCSLMEFFTSLILEKIFKVRWWDYSTHRFNLDGRICLSNTILFGLGGLIIFYFLNPIILPLINKINKNILIIITLILIAIFVIDFIVSVVVLIKLKLSSRHFSKKDVSEELINLRNNALKRNSLLFNRLLNAFPKVEGKDKEKIEDLKRRVNEIRGKIKEGKLNNKNKKKNCTK